MIGAIPKPRSGTAITTMTPTVGVVLIRMYETTTNETTAPTRRGIMSNAPANFSMSLLLTAEISPVEISLGRSAPRSTAFRPTSACSLDMQIKYEATPH